MSRPLHLVRLQIDPRKLYGFAKRSGAAARDYDEGYAVHALLRALFDHGAPENERLAPKPFHIRSSTVRSLDVLGYAAVPHEVLVERAKTFADPTAWGVCDLDGAASKPMPDHLPSGSRLGFFVRTCPIRRIAKRGPMTRGRAEVDAFLAKAWEVGPDTALEREEVYREWLVEELAKDGAAKVLQATMTTFRLGRLHRRTQGEQRKGHRTQRPDVAFEGELEVSEAEGFRHRLERGVGRHRAFGFGMLLLAPPRSG